MGMTKTNGRRIQVLRLPALLAAASLVLLPLGALSAEQPHVGRELSLEEAVSFALERSPDVAEAQSRLAEAEARLRVARSGRMPTLRARGTYDSWTEDQRLYPATENGEPGLFGSGILAGEIVASVPLFTGGRVSGEIGAAEWNRVAAGSQLTRARDLLVFQVTALYYTLLAEAEVVRSLESAVLSMDEQQRAIQALVDAQKAARVDLLRANVRRSELHDRLVRERSLREAQQWSWAALLGWDDVPAPSAGGALGPREVPLGPDAAAHVSSALARRPDYQAAQAAVASGEAGVRAARAGFWPSLFAQASYGERWMTNVSDQPAGVDDQFAIGRVGLVAEIPLFDGGLTGARVAEQKARLLGAQERLRRLELQVRGDVESAVSDVASAHERVQTSELAVAQAEESFRIMKEKYDLGKGTMTDVLDAQAALIAVQTGHARALADLNIADARLRLATGESSP